jgi:ribosomal protein L29
MATEKAKPVKEVAKQSANDEKLAELRVELLKSGAKRQRIKREIARILTLQNSKMKTGEQK